MCALNEQSGDLEAREGSTRDSQEEYLLLSQKLMGILIKYQIPFYKMCVERFSSHTVDSSNNEKIVIEYDLDHVFCAVNPHAKTLAYMRVVSFHSQAFSLVVVRHSSY